VPNALFSLGNKEGLIEVAAALKELDPTWQFFGSKGTAEKLDQAHFDAIDIATLVGDPSPDHLVVTLSAIHFGILADPERPDHMAWLAEHKLPYIDMVWVSLYDLEGAIVAQKSEAEVRAATDMGGIALLRSGAKGRRLVSSNLRNTRRILEWLRQGQPYEVGFRTWLAWQAEKRAAEYCQASEMYLKSLIISDTKYGIPDICPPLFGIDIFDV